MSLPTRALGAALLMMIGLLLAAPAAAQVGDPDPARFDEAIAAFVEYDSKNSAPADAVLFVGSSSIRLWPTAERFPRLTVINRGFGGSHISDVNYHLDATVLKYAVDIIVFYAGDNDIQAGKTPARVLADYQQFVERVHAAKSETDIIYIPIKPSVARWDKWPVIQEANAAVRTYTEGNPRLHYADVVPPMLGADGRPRPELLVEDGLHMTPLGYDIWTDVVSRSIDALSRR
jgi:lysophospholipase L1-like esterase